MKNKQFIAVILTGAVIIAVVALSALKSRAPSEQPLSSDTPVPENIPDPVKLAPEPDIDSAPTLAEIISTATTWQPAFTFWTGKPAPDFTLTDITGNTHTLSQYRGKDVLIIFWATWCRPCLMEIPHLIALRNIIDHDKLVMLAISNENPQLVKTFAANAKLNYTVFAVPDTAALPEPYNRITSIPSSFFIDRDGKIKLATAGLLSLGPIKAILAAQ